MLCYDFQKKYSETDLKALEKKHTKQLLKERNSSYIRSEYCMDCCGDREECSECQSNIEFNRAVLKRLLATREHVLNKQESKALRKQRIKEGK